MYCIVQLSTHRYAVGKLHNGAMGNLRIYSDNELGEEHQMISMPRVDLETRPLKYKQAQKYLCYRQTGTQLTAELYSYLQERKLP
jgi:hypothetical protein